MTPDPVTLPASTTVDEAARRMRDLGIGDVLVSDGGRLCGVVTDRDIVVRGIAYGRDPAITPLRDICSNELVALDTTATVDEAVRLMSSRAIRRVPVLDHGRAVGMVSIGDLALERDPHSTLADISAAPPNT